ncbi:MAG: AAA family ATPase [Rubrivivax sp.]|nr:AAA family ATPase [Rubrivivax sp.]
MLETHAAHLQLLASPCLWLGPVRHELPDSVPGYLVACLGAQGDWVLRDELAALFWPRADEATAQHNLRVNLNRLRPLLRRWQLEPALLAEPRRLRMSLPSDVERLRGACARGDWLTAAALPHRGFATGLSFRSFPALGEWAASQRGVLLAQWREAVLRAVPLVPPRAASDLLRRVFELDRCDETVLRALFDALLADGRRDEALAAFEDLQRCLREQLGTVAEAELHAHVQRQLGGHSIDDVPPPGAAASPTKLPHAVLQPPRLVAREAESATLQDPLERVVLVAGVAGVGKTRLLEENLPAAAWLRCHETDGAALAPLVAWLDDQRLALPALEGPWADLRRLLPDAVAARDAGPDDAGEVPMRVLQAAAGLLQASAAAVVADDAQWLDASTAELLMQLARAGRTRLIVAFRPGELRPEAQALVAALAQQQGVRQLALQPLDSAGLAHLLAVVARAAPDAAPLAAAWLHERSGGNPFYALELLRDRFEGRQLDAGDAHWIARLEAQAADLRASALPARLGELIQRRVRRLSDAAQRLLAATAVAGEVHEVEGLADAAELSPWVAAQALAQARSAGLLDGRRFAHELVREAVQHALSAEALRWTHARVARSLAAQLPPEARAQHWWAAGQPLPALQAAWEAVHLARSRGLHAHLLPQLARWQAQQPHDGRACASLLTARALLLQELARHEEAEEAAQTALAQWPDPAERAWAMLVLARIAFQAGSLAQAQLRCDEAAQCDPGNLDVLRLASQLALQRGDAAGAMPALAVELQALRRAPAGSALAVALTSLGALHDELGQTERGLPLHEEAWALAERLQARRTQVDVAINLLWCCCALPQHRQRGLTCAEGALALGEYDGSDTLRNNLAWAYADAGQVDRALALYRQLAGGRDPSLACIAWSRIVGLLAATGVRGPAMDEALAQTLGSMQGTDFYVAHASAVVALVQHGSGEQARAARCYVRDGQPLDPWLQQRLEQALRSRP